MKQAWNHQPKSLKPSTSGWKAQTSAPLAPRFASPHGVCSEFGRPHTAVHITEPPHVMQHNFCQLVVSLQEKPEADAADTSLESLVRLGRLEITGGSVRLCLCVCVYKKQEWGELTIQPVFNIPSSYTRKKPPEILIIMQDKQNSNSSRLKISSYLTPKVEENQSEEVKLKKKKKTTQIFPHKIGKILSSALSQALHCCWCQSKF